MHQFKSKASQKKQAYNKMTYIVEEYFYNKELFVKISTINEDITAFVYPNFGEWSDGTNLLPKPFELIVTGTKEEIIAQIEENFPEMML